MTIWLSNIRLLALINERGIGDDFMDPILMCPYCCQPNSVYDQRCVRCGRILDHQEMILDATKTWY